MLFDQNTDRRDAARAAATPAPAPGDMPDPRAVLNSIGEAVYDWDVASDRLRWGANICEVLDLDDAGLISTGLGLAGHLAPESPGNRYEAVMAACEHDSGGGAPYQVQYGLAIQGRSGRGDARGRIWIEDTGRAFAGPDRRPVRAHGIIRVISEQLETRRQLAFRSIFDSLTGALNRANITSHVSRLFAHSARTQSTFALLMVGIKDLAAINQRLGYDVADELIGGIAVRLRANMRATDVIGRYSGNKFALVLDSCSEEQMHVAARRLIQGVEEQGIASSAGPVAVSLQVGCVLAPRHARQTQQLLQHAEEALDKARALHSNRMAVYEPDLAREEARRRARRLSEDIVCALNARRVALAFQPVVAAGSHQPVFHEALLRMHNADGSVSTPGEIVPMAEQAGLVTLIDHRVLELALARLSAEPALKLAVNASAATLFDPQWPAHLAAVLRMNPGAAPRLMIEIGEAAAALDVEATAAAIKAMKDLGVLVSLDHFGSGHTSFRTLRALGFDLLKIDGAFMQNLEQSRDDRFFVRTLVEIARHLGIPTVAEWVEDAASARLLAEWGVDYLQGHHFGPALELQPQIAAAGSAKVA